MANDPHDPNACGPGNRSAPWLAFLAANALLFVFVFRGGLWGSDLLAPLDILPAVASKYHFMDPASSKIPANQFIVDQVAYDLPIQTTIYDSYRRGEIPWWDPYNCCGRPLLAEAHINGTEPIRVLAYLTLPFELAYNWARVLNYLFGGLAMLLLLRHWNFRGTICVLLALAYEFSGGFVLHFGHPWIQAQFNYYPLLWLAWDAWFTRRSWWSFPLATAAVAGVLNAGNLQSHAYLVLFTGAILLGYGGRSPAAWKAILPVVVLSGILGAALASPVLLGEIELYVHRTRNVGIRAEENAIGGFGTIATFFPWALGTFRTLDLGKLFNSSNMGFYLFIGSPAAVAALFAAVRGAARTELSPVRRTALWLVVIYSLAVCTPLVSVLYTRCAGLGVLGITALATIGIEGVFAMADPLKRWGRWLTVLLVLTLIGLNVASLVIYPRFLPKIRQMVNERAKRTTSGMGEADALREFQINNFGHEVSLKNPETIVAAAGILLLAAICFQPELRRRRGVLGLLLILNLLPVAGFAGRFIPVQPISLWERLRSADSEPARVARVLEPGHERLWDDGSATFDKLYPNAMAHYFHVHVVYGYSSLQPPNFSTLSPEEFHRVASDAADYVYRTPAPWSETGELKKNRTSGMARFGWANGSDRELRIETETMNSIRLSIGSGPEADLIRRDTWFPGWSARVAGGSVPVEKMEPFYSEMRIPPGPQVLELHYVPIFFHAGLVLAGLSLVVTVFMTLMLARRR